MKSIASSFPVTRQNFSSKFDSMGSTQTYATLSTDLAMLARLNLWPRGVPVDHARREHVPQQAEGLYWNSATRSVQDRLYFLTFAKVRHGMTASDGASDRTDHKPPRTNGGIKC